MRRTRRTRPASPPSSNAPPMPQTARWTNEKPSRKASATTSPPRPRPTGSRARAGAKRHRPERGSRRRRRHGRYRQRTRGGAARVVPRRPFAEGDTLEALQALIGPRAVGEAALPSAGGFPYENPARLLPPRVVRRAYRHRRSVRLRGPARARFLHGEHRATVQGGARPPRGIRHRSRAIRRERRRAHRCRLPALRRRRHRLGQRLVEQRAGARRPRRRVR